MRSTTKPVSTNPGNDNTMTTKQERRLRSFEALQIALAIEDAKHMPTSPELERQVDRLYTAGRRRMAQLRYAENVLWPVRIVSGEIRPEIDAMTRPEGSAALGDGRGKH